MLAERFLELEAQFEQTKRDHSLLTERVRSLEEDLRLSKSMRRELEVKFEGYREGVRDAAQSRQKGPWMFGGL